MRPLASLGLAALVVTPVTRADEPTARSTASAEPSKPDGRNGQPGVPIARQYALPGVDCEAEKDTARKVMAGERMTWPSWFDGAPGTGPIAARYHVRGYPSVFVIDAGGVIRSRSVADLDQTVEKLLAGMKPRAAG